MAANGANESIVILGIDPGTIAVGWGAVRVQGGAPRAIDWGTLCAGGSDFGARLCAIFQGLGQVLDAQRPDVVAIEEVFFAKNARSAIKIGEGRAIALLCAALREVKVAEYSPSEVKRAVTGNGQAHKEQVLELVRIQLGLPRPPDSDHAADALALAICHAHRLPASAVPARRPVPPPRAVKP